MPFGSVGFNLLQHVLWLGPPRSLSVSLFVFLSHSQGRDTEECQCRDKHLYSCTCRKGEIQKNASTEISISTLAPAERERYRRVPVQR